MFDIRKYLEVKMMAKIRKIVKEKMARKETL